METKTKAKLGAKTAKTVVKRRWLGKMAFRVGKPVAQHKVRRRVERVATTARAAGEWAVVVGPVAAKAFGLVQPPKRTHTARRVVLGVVIGATAMYYLRRNDREPGPKAGFSDGVT
jgi:hypothetical protein